MRGECDAASVYKSLMFQLLLFKMALYILHADAEQKV